MEIDERAKIAFASVSDLTKQLITLGTGVLTLGIGFTKLFVEATLTVRWQIQVSWLALLVSISGGVWVLMAIAGKIAKTDTLAARDVYAPSIRIPALIQILSFIIGLVFTAWFGLNSK